MSVSHARPTIPDDVVYRELDGSLVVTSLSAGGFLHLDDVGRAIWSALERGEDVEAIVETLRIAYDVPADVCRTDVNAFLSDLATRGLIAWTGATR